ncbi:hypothetical protein FQ154_20510 [Paeniglutamicibacter gangotriensis]|uniref:Uncharacterized protein n=1 Tax=Paeniglutamicibacter gangotriensis TaxID=254787 RepID=A0A5B0E041_9MICC|nr:hypothetical protein [Paeniglutamicibacter gangotriensis]KAA0971301.1 hypothetical protein FQ154_20510 [Paeniglutamicibacter gangotriensis]
MISDSIPWRVELARIASRLERKSRQESWSERSTFRTEKDLMLVGYAIRRLTEARKLADSLVAAQVPVLRFPRVGVIPDVYNKEDIDKHYALDAPVQSQIKLGHFCNQLIHSYIFMHSFEDIIEPVEQEDGTILDGVRYFNGVFVASEHERYKHVYFFPLDAITALCRKVAAEDIVGVDMRRDKDGLMQISHVISSADEEVRLIEGH